MDSRDLFWLNVNVYFRFSKVNQNDTKSNFLKLLKQVLAEYMSLICEESKQESENLALFLIRDHVLDLLLHFG